MYWNTFKNYPATVTLVSCQTLIFFIEVLLCDTTTQFLHITPDVLVKLGALVHNAPFDPLHLTSATFLHADSLHFAFNLVTLYSLIRAFEIHLGTLRALIGFVSAGVISNALSFLYHHQGITVGASGALVAIATALLLLDLERTLLGQNLGIVTPTGKKFSNSTALPSPIATRLQSFFALGTSLMPSLSGGSVDYAAHLGGVIAGLILCLFFLTTPAPSYSK